MQKSQSQAQYAIVGLAHNWFWNPQRESISCQLYINFYIRMCVQGYLKLVGFFFQNKKSHYQSQYLRLVMVSVSVSIFDTKGKSLSVSLNFLVQFIKCQSQSQNLIPILKISVSKTETGYTESQSQFQNCKNWFRTSLMKRGLYIRVGWKLKEYKNEYWLP